MPLPPISRRDTGIRPQANNQSGSRKNHGLNTELGAHAEGAPVFFCPFPATLRAGA